MPACVAHHASVRHSTLHCMHATMSVLTCSRHKHAVGLYRAPAVQQPFCMHRCAHRSCQNGSCWHVVLTQHWFAVQGDCKGPAPASANTVVPLLDRQCRISADTGIMETSRKSSLWLDNLSLVIKRADPQKGKMRRVAFAAGQNSKLWMTNMNFVGDTGPAAALYADNNADVYIAGALSNALCAAGAKLPLTYVMFAQEYGLKPAFFTVICTSSNPKVMLCADSVVALMVAVDLAQSAVRVEDATVAMDRVLFYQNYAVEASLVHASKPDGMRLLLQNVTFSENDLPDDSFLSQVDATAVIVSNPPQDVLDVETDDLRQAWPTRKHNVRSFLSPDDPWLPTNLDGVSISDPPFWRAQGTDDKAPATPDGSTATLPTTSDSSGGGGGGAMVGVLVTLAILLGLIVLLATILVRRRRQQAAELRSRGKLGWGGDAYGTGGDAYDPGMNVRLAQLACMMSSCLRCGQVTQHASPYRATAQVSMSSALNVSCTAMANLVLCASVVCWCAEPRRRDCRGGHGHRDAASARLRQGSPRQIAQPRAQPGGRVRRWHRQLG